MTKPLLRIVHETSTALLVLGLAVLPLACTHCQTPGVETVASSETPPEMQSRKPEPPFKTYHHLGHSHFQRNTPTRSEDR